MQIRDTDGSEELVMNLAPMIDVVFLLLIFFMVATTFVDQEKEMSVDLPLAESGEAATPAPEEVVLNLMADGSIVMNGVAVETDDLRGHLERLARGNPETPVTIRGDKKVFHEHVVSLMDTCRLAGLVNLGLMTIDS
ncbi:MAG: biopolymer transport protein ExbD [Planctomycetota bacterium]|jgi:biopolymer transport protein ExbD